ncbi:DNA polymerase III subunit beta [Streptomyces sp. NPDC090022]|uniref:DNA polymerase III subunit beta n=1 Tax=Streptomyces sp. NPDC090022 TaxID=3365920 RepID=UPI0038245927
MEFRIGRAELAGAVGWAARAVPARTPVPVLGGLLLDAREGRLRVSGFDYEASARVEVPAATAVEGGVLVLGRRLLDICKVLPEGEVTCVLDGARFTVEGAEGTRFGLSTLPREDYPPRPALPAVRGAVDAAAFAEAVAQVAVAAGRDEALPVLTGIQVRLDGAELTLAASDRYRYAVRTLAWQPGDPGSDAVEVVVPGRRLAEIARSLAKSGPVRIGCEGGLIGFEAGGRAATLRLLEGRLPRYDKLFALDGAAVAVTGRAALADAVRRVAVVAEPNSPVRLDFRGDGSVLLRAGYADDVASQALAATLTGADAMAVAFNPAYLLDALTSFTGPDVRFDLQGPGQRVLLGTGTGDAGTGDTGHRHLLMSVRQLD